MSRIPYKKSYDIAGYTCSDGYCLCPDCAVIFFETGNGDDLTPIFCSDEYEEIPSCDQCLEGLDDVTLIESSDDFYAIEGGF